MFQPRYMRCLLLLIACCVLGSGNVLQAAPAPARHPAAQPLTAPLPASKGLLPNKQPTQQLESIGYLGGPVTSVAVQGQYAYVGVARHIEILDLTTPSQPQVVGQTALFPEPIIDLDVAGDYVYVATGTAGLHIVDVRMPNAPRVVKTIDTLPASQIHVVGSYAYINVAERVGNGTRCCQELRIIDVGTPSAAREVGRYTAHSISQFTVQDTYIYAATADGLRILDVSTPSAPREVGLYHPPSGYINSLVLADDYVYIDADGLRIVDITTPSNPREVSTTNLDAGTLAIVGERLYSFGQVGASDTSVGHPELRIVDIGEPTAPRIVKLTTPPLISGYAPQIAVVGSTIYLAGISIGGDLSIIDVAQPDDPASVGSYSPAISSANKVALVGDYAYLLGSGAVRVVDIRSSTNPRVVALIAPPNEGGVFRDIAVVGSRVYLTNGAAGLRIFDASDPAQPREVGSVAPSGLDAADLAIAGPYAYVSNYGPAGSQYVIDVADATQPRVVSTLQVGWTFSVAATDKYAYFATVDGLVIVDTSNPRQPREVSRVGQRSTQGVVVAGNYAYVISQGVLQVVNISDPANPRAGTPYVGGVPGAHIPRYTASITLVNNYLYLAGDTLRIIDIGEPQHPREVAAYNISTYGVAVRGPDVYLTSFVGNEALTIARFGPASLSGRVVDARNKPMMGVKIALSNGASATTDATGSYTITNVLPGTYTITPTLGNFAFVPPVRSIAVPPAATHNNFTVLPKPISAKLTPGTATTLAFTDTQGLRTEIRVPADAVNAPMTLVVTPTVAMSGAGQAFTGHAFTLAATRNDATVPNLTFGTPLTATLRYSNADVAVVSNEPQLMLRRIDPQTGQPSACDADGTKRDSANNVLMAPVCHVGTYGLFGPTYQRFFPVGHRLQQDSNTYVTGVQVQNLGERAANISLAYVSPDGTLAALQGDSIAARAARNYYGTTMAVPADFEGAISVSSSQPIVATSNILNTATNTGASHNGIAAGATRVDLPLVLKNNFGQNTWLTVQNTGTTAANVQLTYFVAANKTVTETATLPAGAARIFRQDSQPLLPYRFVGAARVESTNGVPLAVVVHQESPTQLLSYTGFGAGTAAQTLLAPLIVANNFGLWSGVQVQNSGNKATEVTLTYSPNTAVTPAPGKTLCPTPSAVQAEVAAGESHTFIQSAEGLTAYGFDPQFRDCTYIGSATITAEQPLVAIVNEVQTGSGAGASAYEAVDPAALTDTQYLPLVQARNYGTFSGIQLQNASAITGTFTLTYEPNAVDPQTYRGGPLCATPEGQAITLAPQQSQRVIQANGNRADGFDDQFANCSYVGAVTIQGPLGSKVAAIVNQVIPNYTDALTTYNGFNR